MAISEYFGGRRIHSTHGVHPQAPNRDIFRLSNRPDHGIVGVGPQWHNDGSFLNAVFSHVGYYIVHATSKGGETEYAHTGLAYDALTAEEKKSWGELVSVNSNGGVLHPVVLRHPITQRNHVYLHLGMTGAVMRVKEEGGRPQLTLLTENEMRTLFNRYNDLLASIAYPHYYATGDLVVIDNLAVAHRAAPSAHDASNDLRIMHRTTVQGMVSFDPDQHAGEKRLREIWSALVKQGMPNVLDIMGRNPFNKDGVWQGGGLGYRWDEKIRMQN